MRLFRPGFLAGCLYPDALFRIKTAEKVLYLTFDDGPHPDSTPIVLTLLKKNNVSASFFCTGKAASQLPDLVKRINDEGHVTGNHTFNHIDGWKTAADEYVNDINRAAELTSDRIFRPPFGRLRLKQYSILKKRFRIVFWDLMAYDFDSSFGSKKSLEILKRKMRPGSIIVLHDTPASCAKTILEEFVKYALKEGYRFELPDFER
jgi:peptidoglycan/xylan/chitin deacetylase (PgdA/CDA1 family)